MRVLRRRTIVVFREGTIRIGFPRMAAGHTGHTYRGNLNCGVFGTAKGQGEELEC